MAGVQVIIPSKFNILSDCRAWHGDCKLNMGVLYCYMDRIFKNLWWKQSEKPIEFSMVWFIVFVPLLSLVASSYGGEEREPFFGVLPQKPVEGQASPVGTPKEGPLKLLWRFETGGGVYSSPLVVNDRVYIGSKDGHLYALDGKSGRPLWKFKTSGEVTTIPAILNRTLFFGSKDGYLYAVSAENGSLQWKLKTGGKVVSSPKVHNGIIYFGSNDRNLYAVDPSTGKLLWNTTLSDYKFSGIYSSPAVSDGAVYVATKDTVVWALDGKSGKALWSFNTNSAIYSSPVVAKNILYVGSYDRNLYAINSRNGKLLWKVEFLDWLYATPVVKDWVVYVGAKDGELSALDGNNGEVLWSQRFKDPISSSLVLVDADSGLIGTEGGLIYVINLKTGAVTSGVDAGGGLHSTPVISGDTVYAGSTNGSVYAWHKKGDKK